MSSIYHTEPPTQGKVLIKTSHGDIDVELWPKEAPLACRNFIQLALEGYYDKTIVHRIIKVLVVDFLQSIYELIIGIYGTNGRSLWHWTRWRIYLGKTI